MKRSASHLDGPRLRARIVMAALAACTVMMVAPALATQSTPVAPVIQHP